MASSGFQLAQDEAQDDQEEGQQRLNEAHDSQDEAQDGHDRTKEESPSASRSIATQVTGSGQEL